MLSHLLAPGRHRLGRRRQPHPHEIETTAPRRHPRARQRPPARRLRRLRPGAHRGHEHEGIDLRSAGRATASTSRACVGASAWLYPQTDVFIDLADARARDGGDVRFGVTDTTVERRHRWHPVIRFTDADGVAHEIRCDYPGRRRRLPQHLPARRSRRRSGASTSASTRSPGSASCARRPPSAPELIYTHSDRGFALISQRTETRPADVLPVRPGRGRRRAGPTTGSGASCRPGSPAQTGSRCRRGPIIEKTVLPFRSFVQEPMRLRQPAARRRRRAHRPADRRQGPQPRPRRRAGARRGARARARARTTPTPSTTYTRPRAGRGCGRRSTSPTG